MTCLLVATGVALMPMPLPCVALCLVSLVAVGKPLPHVSASHRMHQYESTRSGIPSTQV